MKIKEVIELRNTVLKSHLIKSKIYNKNLRLKTIEIEDIECRLKKALSVIYKFHSAHKRIIFMGIPKDENQHFSSLFEDTEHSLIPENMWLNGVLTNPLPNFKHLLRYNKKIDFPEILLQLKKKSDLIVTLNSLTSLPALEESYTEKIPIISFNTLLDVTSVKPSYKIPGAFISSKSQIRNNFLMTAIPLILRKAHQLPVEKVVRKDIYKDVSNFRPNFFKSRY